MRIEGNFATEFRMIIEGRAAHRPPREDSPEELDIELEGKELTQEDSFVYLGRALCRDMKTEREARRRVRKIARVTRADRSAKELDRETDEKQTIAGRTHRYDCG